jgi:hypothetical protein
MYEIEGPHLISVAADHAPDRSIASRCSTAFAHPPRKLPPASSLLQFLNRDPEALTTASLGLPEGLPIATAA